jgi:hypothetical protein
MWLLAASVAPCRGSTLFLLTIHHGLTGLLKKALYVSPSGYVPVFRFLSTQGVALGCPMKPLRGTR